MRNDKLKILISCICLISIYANAYSSLWGPWEVDGINYDTNDYTYDEDKKELHIKTVYVCRTYSDSYPISQYSGDITIPSYVVISGQAVRVTTIGIEAFYGSDVTSVTLSPSVKTIERDAFKGCSKLTKVIMPGVEDIDSDAFAGCGLIEKITIPLSLSDCELAFSDMSGLKEFEVEEGNPKFCAIDGILYNHDITRLLCVPATKTTVQIPSTVTEIYDYSFYKSSISSIEIPSSVKHIGDYAFSETKNLKSITIPKNIEFVGTHAFRSSGIERLEYLSTSISCKSAFTACSHISEIIFSPEFHKIPDGMFSESIFENIKLNINSIGQCAFSSCSFGNLILGEDVEKIYYAAFLFADIQNISCFSSTPPEFEYPDPNHDSYNPEYYRNITPFSEEIYDECNLFVYDNCLSHYKTASTWRKFKNIKTIPPTGAVKEAADSGESYTINGNTVSVEAEAGTEVAVYSIDGTPRFEGNGPASIELASGLYILKIGNKTQRICIRSL